jgi:hypothetical protein
MKIATLYEPFEEPASPLIRKGNATCLIESTGGER